MQGNEADKLEESDVVHKKLFSATSNRPAEYNHR